MRSASPGATLSRTVVDIYPVRRRRGEFVPVDCGVGPRDDRPAVRVRGRFAGEVAGIELREGGAESSGSNTTLAATGRRRRSRAMRSTSVMNASAAVSAHEADTSEDRRSPRVATTADEYVDPRSARARMLRYRHPDHAGSRRSQPAGDRLLRYRRPILCHRGPVPGREVLRSGRSLGSPHFPVAAPAAVAPRTARARRRGLPRRIARTG